MKQDIEQLFRDALSNAELPYEPGAWEAMSARLGAPKTGFSKKVKWIISAAVVVTGTGVFALLTNSGQKASTERPTETVQTTTSVGAVETSQATVNLAETNDAKTPVPQIQAVPAQSENAPRTVDNVSNTFIPSLVLPLFEPIVIPELNPVGRPGGSIMLLPPSLPNHICAGEKLEIRNPNNQPIAVETNGQIFRINGKDSAVIEAPDHGKILVTAGEHSRSINIIEAASADITGNDQVLFEAGIPQLNFRTTSGLQNVEWSSSSPFTASGESVIVHPYHGKTVTVELTGTDRNGCPVKETRRIQVDEYNLMAPNVFTPDYNDLNQYFMPFALTQRDTPFDLYIYDAKNGVEIFRTSDASKGWDGRDGRNGDLVAEKSVWVWKVVLKNPKPGEVPVYQGTIQRM